MQNNLGGKALNGHVRGVSSRRHGGVVFPLDLVRVVARVVNRGGWRRRVAAACAGYLVTESRHVPVWRGADGRVLTLLCTKERHSGLRDDIEGLGVNEWSMDAPIYIAGGSVMTDAIDGGVCARQRVAMRAGRYA